MAKLTMYPKLREVILENGERFAFLVDELGIPLDEPMLFCVIRLRNQHRAYKTLQHYLLAIGFLYRWASSAGIDLQEAVRSGTKLSLREIEAFASAVSKPVAHLQKNNLLHFDINRVKPLALTSKEGVRPKAAKIGSPEKRSNISIPHAKGRLSVARHFLAWWTQHELAKKNHQPELYRTYFEWRKCVLEALDSQISPSYAFHHDSVREGLSEKAQAILIEAVEPKSPNNPFNTPFTKQRNQLIILMLLGLGMRSSELLNIKTADLNFQAGTIHILRRPDDIDDKRKREPNVKTRPRELELLPQWISLLLAYIKTGRNQFKRARRHDFLIVSDEGEPLSQAAMGLIFRTLRQKVAGLPSQFTAHQLRHTWNDNFSRMMTRQKVSPEKEMQLRSYYMGWSPTSNTAVTYTKRYVREEASKYTVKLQETIHSQERGIS